MPGLQPEIMIVYGIHQNGCNACAVGAQGVGIDLIADQSRLRGRDAVSIQTFPNPLGEGLFCVGNHIDPPLPAEAGNPVVVAVGHDAQPDVLLRIHGLQPAFHFLRRNGSGIGDDGIVKIQHQQPDLPLPQQLRGDIRCLAGDDFR